MTAPDPAATGRDGLLGPPATGCDDAAILARILPAARYPPLEVARLALLVIDLQVLCAAPGYGMLGTADDLGRPDLVAPYRERLDSVVVPNVSALLAAARRAGVPVVYTRIASATPDGRGRSACHQALGLHVPPGHVEGDILPALAPEPGEPVVSKTTSDAFIGTDLDELLRARGVRHLAVCGVLTDECVSSTVRHAADLDYTPHLVVDGCAAVLPEDHEAAVRTLVRTYATRTDAATLLATLASTAEPG